mgnify:CR=1 FL=1
MKYWIHVNFSGQTEFERKDRIYKMPGRLVYKSESAPFHAGFVYETSKDVRTILDEARTACGRNDQISVWELGSRCEFSSRYGDIAEHFYSCSKQ